MNSLEYLDDLERKVMIDSRSLSNAEFIEKYQADLPTTLANIFVERNRLNTARVKPTPFFLKAKNFIKEEFIFVFLILCVVAMVVAGVFRLFGQKEVAKIVFDSAIGAIIFFTILRFIISIIWSSKSVGKIFDNANDYDKSLSLMNSGNYKKAISLLTKLVKEDPQNQDYWFKLGEAYDDLSDHEAALPCYQKCIELKSSHGTTFAPTAYNNIGRIYSKKADYKKAREYFETALQLGSPLAKDNLAILDRIENSH